MQKLEAGCGFGPAPTQREDLVTAVVEDFSSLAEILGAVREQKGQLDGLQSDCIDRANRAAARGVQLSKRLSHRGARSG